MAVAINGTPLECKVNPSLTINGSSVWQPPVTINGLAQLGITINNYEYPPAPENAVLYLPGLPGQGATIWDRTASGNHGAITGATWTRLPSGLWYLSYDGVNDKVTITDSASLQITSAITVEMWINSSWDTATGFNYCYLLDKTAFQLYQHIANKTLSFEVVIGAGGNGVTSGDMTAYFGKWFHAVGTFSGTVVNLYIDAVPLTPVAYVGAMDSSVGINLILGDRVAGARPCKAKQALVRVYKDYVMPQAVVTNHRNQERWMFGV